MKTINVHNGPQNASAIVLGCLRMKTLSVEEAEKMLHSALELGINYFDNATCYGNGEAEQRFGDAFAKSGIRREDVILQTKCGISFDRDEFDWRKEVILSSAEDSLRRLGTDHLDVLLLHRPDLIFEPEQVAGAFDQLEKQGKVRYFGVSNVSVMQLELLRRYVRQPLVIDQLQFSLEQSQLIDQALYVNNKTTERSVDRDNGTLDYCRLHDITVQAWSPLQFGMIGGCFLDHPDYPELNEALGRLGEQYGVSKSAIAIAWILRHPAGMQAVVGTMDPVHLKEIADASKVELTHHEWYELYLASGKVLP